jgi:hypothetical protein
VEPAVSIFSEEVHPADHNLDSYFRNIISSLLNSTISISDYIASYDRVVSELEWMWKEVIIPSFDIVSWHLPGGTEENHKMPVEIADLGAEV